VDTLAKGERNCSHRCGRFLERFHDATIGVQLARVAMRSRFRDGALKPAKLDFPGRCRPGEAERQKDSSLCSSFRGARFVERSWAVWYSIATPLRRLRIQRLYLRFGAQDVVRLVIGECGRRCDQYATEQSRGYRR
jgi:hypothetical protein